MKSGEHAECKIAISTLCWVFCRARKTTQERNLSQALQLWGVVVVDEGGGGEVGVSSSAKHRLEAWLKT